MTRLLASIDNSAAARPVLVMSLVVAPVLGAQVEAVHVGDAGDTARNEAAALGVPMTEVEAEPLAAVAELTSADDVVAVAVGARDRTGGSRHIAHFAERLADAVDKPVLLVAPDTAIPKRLHRVIAAIKGTHDRTRPLRRALAIIGQGQLDLVVVHVQGDESIPAFSDQPQYEAAAYAAEFLARHVPGAPEARAQLRYGDPVEQILAAVAEERAELIAVGWTQGTRPERGLVARALVLRSPVPILLVPLASPPA